MLRRSAALTLILVLVACCLPSVCVLAGPEEKIVRVGWYDSSFNSMDPSSRRSGYAYEYQMKIAAYTGWRYEYVNGSWSELLQMLIDGEIDLMSDVSYTESRAEQMLFCSVPMGTEEYCLFVSGENSAISSTDYSTLNGKRIGVNKNSVQADFYREWCRRQGVISEIVDVTGSEEESLNLLRSGALDGYVTVDSFSADQMETRPVPICKVGSSDFFFAVSASRPDLLRELEGAMNRIREENRNYSQQLTAKYLVSTGANAFLSPEEQTWLGSHTPIRVGYQDNYMAFCARDPETGALTGALKDYLDIVTTSVLNAKLVFEPVAYPTATAALEAMKNGEVDCVFPANLSVGDGEALGLFMTPPLISTDIMAVVRQTSQQLLTSRQHVVVAVNEGNPNYDSFLHDHYPTWRVVYYPTTNDCLQAVSQNVADCVLISSYRYNNIARQCTRLRLTAISTGIDLDYCFAVSAGSSELYSILSRAAGLVPASTMNTALSYYLTEDAKTTLGDFLSEHSWAVAGIVGAVVLVILILMIRSMNAGKKAGRLISATETDELTGLYNRDYFLQYATRLHQEHPEMPMDAVVLNIDGFHSVNAIHGRAFGDAVLRALGGEIRVISGELGGIAGRFEADRFDIYCPQQQDYHAIHKRLQARLDTVSPSVTIPLRMGVMPWQPDLEAVQMFDRARTACSMARENFQEHLVIFDEEMRKRENYEQRLLNDLRRALDSFEFEVYYQPQYDIQSDPPRLVSAEALVRWNHPELGMIPPVDFITLFERNGKISEVDQYVWSEAARQVARWRDLYGVTLPVSVNLSRVDVFDPALESALEKLLAYNGLAFGALRMEVTESAYTENADQVIRVVEGLRNKGYIVEMDDFGSGYSSLNMLSAMPVDVLKMDRVFIRNIAVNEKDAHLVSLILGIARSMKVQVVAEGVETEEQLRILKDLGCSLVQGFYFSKPLPPDVFEDEIIQKIVKARDESAK